MPDKAIFLDRDDTLIEDPGYISSPDQVKLLDGVGAALSELKSLGFKLIVVTNQSAVARGIITEKVLGAIHDRLRQLLAEHGVFLDGIYYCPYHPDGVIPKYRKESNDRKPNPGMLLTAAKEMKIDLEQSWCIGNGSRDIEAGRRAGCRTILIDVPSRKKQILTSGVLADYRGINLKEAVNIIKKQLRSTIVKQSQAQPAVEQQQQAAVEAEQAIQTDIINEPDTEPAQESDKLDVREVFETLPVIEQKQEEQKIHEPEISSPAKPPEADQGRIEHLLVNIMGQLKSMQRAEMFSEFSVMRLIAGIIQILVFFCLIVSIWFLLSSQDKSNSIFTALGFAIVFQLMSLSFYIMHGRK
jgi:D-glycero-D-manno-heptose 1,7-bisphosphate phosphatase